MFDARIQVSLTPDQWGQGALVATGMKDFTETPGAESVEATAYDLGCWCLYQATTSVALAMDPQARLEDVAQSMLSKSSVKIDTTEEALATSFAPFKQIPEVRTAVLASNHAIRQILRHSRFIGEAPALPSTPWTPEAFAEAGFAVPVGAPLVIAATILGVAAIGGVSWYGVESKRVKAGLDVHVAELAKQAELYKANVAAAVQTQQPIPAAPMVVQRAAKQESDRLLWIAGGGLALIGAGMLGAYLRPKLTRARPVALPARRNPARRRKTAAKQTATKRKTTTKKRPARKKATAKRTTTRRKKTTARRRSNVRRAPSRRVAPQRRNPGRSSAPSTRAAFMAAQKRKGASPKQAAARWAFRQRAKGKAKGRG